VEWGAIIERFEYDLWANGLWLETLRKKGFAEPDTGVFLHILGAQGIWLTRCQGESLNALPKYSPDEAEAKMRELSAGFRTLFEGMAEDRVVDYRRTTGEANRLRVSQIAWHVLNHGTYHRGELRGLCLARGDEAFPETDLAAFYFVRGLNA